jgi:hypothetical protein
MILADLDVVVGQLLLVVLVLGALHLVLVCVLWVLVEVRLAFAIYSYPKQLAPVVVSTTGRYCVLYYLKGLIDTCKCVEIRSLNSWLECSFL